MSGPVLDVNDKRALGAAVRQLAKTCPVMRSAHAAIGVPEWRTRPGGYAGVARIIAFQQVSTKAAAAIWGRVETRLGRVTHSAVLGISEDDLRSCGLSRPKVSHLKSVAAAVESGALDFRRIARRGDDAAREELVAVKGIGPWTADVYLMFCLGRSDVFPHADIGLSEAYRMLAGQTQRHPPKDFLHIGERWRPYRGVAAHMLWAYINAERNRQTGGA